MAVIRVSRRLFATYRSIQQAILHAEPGSRIEVEPGVYREDIYIDKYIELVGVGNKEKTVIQGLENPTVYMGAGYAVIKNLTLKQPRKRGIDTVYIPGGALILDGCTVLGRTGNAITIKGDEAEPIFRRCDLYSRNRAAVEIQNHSKVIIEDCYLSTGDYASIVVLEGHPTIRGCTITGDEGYGIHVADQGKGLFEDCNIYGFDYSPAIGILRGNPRFNNCRIHDCRDSGVVIEEGRGRFHQCHFFSFGDKEFPAARLSKHAQPHFSECVFHNCQGGALLFETAASGLIENSECYGFTHQAAIMIQTEANPQFIHCRIHDGNHEGVVCEQRGKGLLESCEIYSFNGNVISVTDWSELDLSRCQVSKGNGHGAFIAQKSKGVFYETTFENFTHLPAIHVTQAADPKLVECRVQNSISGIKVTENGHGLFEKCVFTGIENDVWEIEEGNPQIHLCQEEGKATTTESQHSEPMNVSVSLQKWLHQLSQLIGQQKVKTELRDFILYLDYLQDRKKLGIKTSEQPDLHAVFVGPEQTGKPEIAAIYGGLLKELAYVDEVEMNTILINEEIIKEDGIDTDAWSTKIDQITSGLVYIDVMTNMEQTFLKQEFLPLLKTFLDTTRHLGSIVVILSTSEPLWRDWCQSIPDLRSLRQYHFEDYTPKEMAQLFRVIAEEEDYTIHLTARDVLIKEMSLLWTQETKQNQLACIRDFFEQVKIVHSLRCSKLPKHLRTKEILTTIMPEDLKRKGQGQVRPDNSEWVKHIRKK